MQLFSFALGWTTRGERLRVTIQSDRAVHGIILSFYPLVSVAPPSVEDNSPFLANGNTPNNSCNLAARYEFSTFQRDATCCILYFYRKYPMAAAPQLVSHYGPEKSQDYPDSDPFHEICISVYRLPDETKTEMY